MSLRVNAVIDTIVRQTTVLIAQLATTAGVRAPLAHIANQVFLDLVGELEAQGVSRKVIADMFGLALRSYQQKVQRLSESATDRGQTLWEAVYGHLRREEVVRRADVLRRFRHDNEASVRGILNDLVASGLVYKTGMGDATMFRVASDADVERAMTDDPGASAESLVWLAAYRDGPVDVAALAEVTSLTVARTTEALEALVAEGRVRADGDRYTAERCLLPMDDEFAWGAAVLDHYQAVVQALVTKLQNGRTRALPDDRVGGSTFVFDVWPGHPEEDAVYGLLASQRAELIALWDRVSAHNEAAGRDRDDAAKVTFYLGQSVRLADDLDEGQA